MPGVGFTDPCRIDGAGLRDGADEYPYLPLIGTIQPVDGQNAWLEDKSRARPLVVKPAYVSLPACEGAPALSKVLAYTPTRS
jgi:hypothetical protein